MSRSALVLLLVSATSAVKVNRDNLVEQSLLPLTDDNLVSTNQEHLFQVMQEDNEDILLEEAKDGASLVERNKNVWFEGYLNTVHPARYCKNAPEHYAGVIGLECEGDKDADKQKNDTSSGGSDKNASNPEHTDKDPSNPDPLPGRNYC